MKILNLYAGIGGNRKLWENDTAITSVENNPDIVTVYKNNFPKDIVFIKDAHEFLLKYYKNYDFIWSSPPCQSHSSFRKNICVRYRGTKPVYPDMRLWQEILFLKHHFEGRWVVENVKPYYKPLIEPSFILDRHYFWSNFQVKEKSFKKDNIRKAQIPQLQEKYGFDLSKYNLKNKRQVLRNCVEPKIGLYIINHALQDIGKKKSDILKK